MKEYNVLILDDVKLIGENVDKRMCEANTSYSLLSGINIKPHYVSIDISNIQTASDEIARIIEARKIDYLLVDRGWFIIIEPDVKGLNNDFLYAENRELVKIEEVLKKIPQHNYNRVKGIIIYTYNDENDFSPERLKEDYINMLPKKFTNKNVELFTPYSEIYHLAKLKLYKFKILQDYKQLGLKTDFKLYGLFMGEILYHKVVSMISQSEKKKFFMKKNLISRNVLILFFIFTGLSIGGNSFYSLLTKDINDYLLIAISIIFSLLMPLLILLLKP